MCCLNQREDFGQKPLTSPISTSTNKQHQIVVQKAELLRGSTSSRHSSSRPSASVSPLRDATRRKIFSVD
ncbi:hypothetical protein NQZ68_027372 [Dissostichus eleginoides]|nr:hypothetical protein NQZ68_027372 [Dissostichus eleginoides]